MTKTKKLLIIPFFGPLPEWMDRYQPPAGYDFLLVTDLEDFKKRCQEILGIDVPIEAGKGKVWDIRPALGLLYAKELLGYTWWGITDLDCVYGDVDKWVTDEFLNELDVHSNHDTYVCGCWSLFRNTKEVNELFMRHPYWKDFMTDPRINAWVEADFSRFLENSGFRYKYTFWQGDPDNPNLDQDGIKLFQSGKEIMMYHFRRQKTWPASLIQS